MVAVCVDGEALSSWIESWRVGSRDKDVEDEKDSLKAWILVCVAASLFRD
jgi:hypothetical protein